MITGDDAAGVVWSDCGVISACIITGGLLSGAFPLLLRLASAQAIFEKKLAKRSDHPRKRVYGYGEAKRHIWESHLHAYGACCTSVSIGVYGSCVPVA